MSVATQQIAGVGVEELGRLPVERLEAEILSLSAHLGSGLYRLLMLIGEYDRRNVAEQDGYRSTAAWVSHRAGIDPRTARDYLRVARALPGLPLIAEAMATGELSYCKARSLTRIARPETEAEMLDFARTTTVVQLDVAVSAYRRCEAESLRKAHERHASRSMTPYTDELGMSGYDVRLSPEDGAVLAAALELAMKLLEGGGASPEDPRSGSREPLLRPEDGPERAGAAEDGAPGCGSREPVRDPGDEDPEDEEPEDGAPESGSREPPCRALDDDGEPPVQAAVPGDEAGFIDGVFTVFDPEEGHWVDGQWVWFDDDEPAPAPGPMVDPHQQQRPTTEKPDGVAQRRADALVHMAHAFLGGGGHGATTPVDNDRYLVMVQVDADVLTGNEGGPGNAGACHLHDGAGLAAATVHRLACSEPLVALVRDQNGNPLYMGRKIRNANRAQRRALAARSSGRCEWPGCDVRTGLLPHHSLEWVADKGPTDINVLVNLCRGHHWAVHEGGCRVVPDAEVGFRFYGAAGDEIPMAPARSTADATIERLNLGAGVTPIAAPAGGTGEQMDLELTVWALLNRSA